MIDSTSDQQKAKPGAWAIIIQSLAKIPLIIIVILIIIELVATFQGKAFIVSDIAVPEELAKRGYGDRTLSDLIMRDSERIKLNSANVAAHSLLIGEPALRKAPDGGFIQDNIMLDLDPDLAKQDFIARRRTLLDSKFPFSELTVYNVISSLTDFFGLRLYEVRISIVRGDDQKYEALLFPRLGQNRSVIAITQSRIEEIGKLPTIDNMIALEAGTPAKESDKQFKELLSAIQFEISKIVYPHALGLDLLNTVPKELANTSIDDGPFRTSVQFYLIRCAADITNSGEREWCDQLARFSDDERAITLLVIHHLMNEQIDVAKDYLKKVKDVKNADFLRRLTTGESKLKLADGYYESTKSDGAPKATLKKTPAKKKRRRK